MMEIDARGIYYRDLNKLIKKLVSDGKRELILQNINGQRYLGDGLKGPAKLIINGTPGNDLAAFASGIELVINGNGQDGIGNTMNDGKIVIHGHAGDITGYAMRGGVIYIKGRVGYRVGIHMKGYLDRQPTIIIGGSAGDFFGEYMAGGRLILLGLNLEEGEDLIGNHVGVGMHGGEIYIRGPVKPYQVGLEVKVFSATEEDKQVLRKLLTPYCQEFDYNLEEILSAGFSKLIPVSSRPYGNLYAY